MRGFSTVLAGERCACVLAVPPGPPPAGCSRFSAVLPESPLVDVAVLLNITRMAKMPAISVTTPKISESLMVGHGSSRRSSAARFPASRSSSAAPTGMPGNDPGVSDAIGRPAVISLIPMFALPERACLLSPSTTRINPCTVTP